MNERIRELAERCYEKHELLGTYEFNKEKFAELIVRETIDELLQQFWNYGIHGHKEVENPSFHYAIKRTKEHFGVKE